MTIDTPVGWVWSRLARANHAVGSVPPDQYWRDQHWRDTAAADPVVQRIGVADLRAALAAGWADFAANRTDVIFLCLLYPVVGLVLWGAASGNGLAPLLFPLASGFVLLGPFAAVGLNEMSRRRELGAPGGWSDALRVLQSPSVVAILLLGLLLSALFVAWLFAATLIYDATLGPLPPASLAAFAHDVAGTAAGWTMAVVGIAVGFVFAVVVLALSVVSFPLLLDRNVRLDTAIATSFHAVARNPLPMALWGLLVAALLLLGSLPLLVGLVVVLPVLGHATWHLYRRVVAR